MRASTAYILYELLNHDRGLYYVLFTEIIQCQTPLSPRSLRIVFAAQSRPQTRERDCVPAKPRKNGHHIAA